MNSESHTETCCNQTSETPESSKKEGSCRTQRIINMLSADFSLEILEAKRPDIVRVLKEEKNLSVENPMCSKTLLCTCKKYSGGPAVEMKGH